MDPLSALAGCGLLLATSCNKPLPGPNGVTPWQPMVSIAATHFGLPPAWVLAVLKQESGGRSMLNGRPITSKAGAMGLMQVMPSTYANMRQQLGLGENAYDPHDNIVAGTAYLQRMYAHYGYPGMFAAYNAGPGRLDDYLSRGRPLPQETLHYLAAVVPGSESAFSGHQIAHPPAFMWALPMSIFVPKAPSNALFVTLSANQ